MVYGYARCSTDETKQDINRQIRELTQKGAVKKNIFLEYESGSKTDRIQLTALLNTIKHGDTVIVTELSRITRSTKQLCEIVELVQERGIKLIIDTFEVDCTREQLDPMTEGMLKMMGVFAEMERKMISQRVKSGMANAKAKGKIIGRPKVTIDKIPNKFLKNYELYRSGGINIAELARIGDMSRTTIYKYIGILENI